MADVIKRTTNSKNRHEFKKSVNSPDYPSGDWLHNPDLSSVSGVPTRHWKVVGETVVEMNQSEKDAADDTVFEHGKFAEADGESQTTADTYQLKVQLTTDELDGAADYRVDWYAELSGSHTGMQTQVKVDVDGSIIAEPIKKVVHVNDYAAYSGTKHLASGTSGVKVISLSFRRQAGNAQRTAYIRRARIILSRI